MSLAEAPVETDVTGALRLSPDNPWPGLAAFSEEDRDYFHGRTAEVAELTRLVRREPLTVLFGRSGLGKTSLLGAGLFPRLREDGYLPVSIRLSYASSTPLSIQVQEALLAACVARNVEGPPPLPGATLWEFFHRSGVAFWNARNRPVTPVLVLDQLEEIFTLGQEDEATRQRSGEFVEELGDLIENRPPAAVRRALDADPEAITGFDFQRSSCKVVLSFREDFLASMEGLKRQIPSLMRNRYRLQPMSGAQAHEAIVKSGGRLLDESVTGRIIGLAWRNAADPPPDPADYPSIEIDPALLSVICRELNLKRQRAGLDRITADLLAGAEREILTDFYEGAFDGLDPRVRTFVEDELITDRGYRDSFALEDALERPGMSRAAVDQLVARRLLRVDERSGVRRLELTHDVLTRVVRESRDSRVAREAEAAAAAREAAARGQQQRNRVYSGLILLGAAAVVGAALYVWYLQRQVEKQTNEATRQSVLAGEMRSSADAAKMDAATRLVAATQAQEVASTAMDAARNATNSARELTEQARATNLTFNARNVRNDFLDRALLLGAEAIREYPHRLDAQVDQLGRILANPQLTLLLRDHTYAFSGDGRMLAAGSSDGSITVWATDTWQVRRRWKGHAGSVSVLALSPDGSHLVSSDAASIVAWRLSGTGEAQRLRDASGSDAQGSDAPGRVTRLLFGPDGTTVALGHSNGTVRLWPIAARNPGPPAATVYQPARDRQDVPCLAFSADGKTLTVVGSEEAARWDVAEPRPQERTKGPGSVRGYSADCGFVAVGKGVGGGASEIQLREVWGGRDLNTLKVTEAVRRVSVSPAGHLLVVATDRGYVLWDATVTPPRRVFADTGRVDEIAFSPGGNTVAIALEGGTVIARDWKSNIQRLSAKVPARQRLADMGSKTIGGLLPSPDGKTLVAYPPSDDSRGRFTAIWSLDRGEILTEPDGTPHQSNEMEFNRRGDILASAKIGQGAYFWDAGSKAPRKPIPDLEVGEFSLDGSKVAVARSDGSVEIRGASGEPLEATLHPPGKRSVSSLALSGNNRRLAIGFYGGSVAVYDLTARPPRSVREFKEHEGATQVAFSPTEETLASAGAEGRVVLWNAAAGRPLPLESHKGAVRRMAFSPDGALLASGSNDRTVGLHDVRRRRLVARFEPHEEAVMSVVFIDGGKALVSGGESGPREVWDIPGRRWLTTLRTPGSVALSSRGRRIAVRHEDHLITLRLWDPPTLLRESCRIAGRNLTCVEWQQYLGDKPYRKTCETSPPPEKCG